MDFFGNFQSKQLTNDRILIDNDQVPATNETNCLLPCRRERASECQSGRAERAERARQKSETHTNLPLHYTEPWTVYVIKSSPRWFVKQDTHRYEVTIFSNVLSFHNCSMLFPGRTDPAIFNSAKFRFTDVNIGDISPWDVTIRNLPSSGQYITKILIGTPTRIDTDVQPVCPACGHEADLFESTTEDAYYCTFHCDQFRDRDIVEPGWEIVTTLRMLFDGARELKQLFPTTFTKRIHPLHPTIHQTMTVKFIRLFSFVSFFQLAKRLTADVTSSGAVTLSDVTCFSAFFSFFVCSNFHKGLGANLILSCPFFSPSFSLFGSIALHGGSLLTSSALCFPLFL